jgi:hypothetical protein
MPSGAVFRLTRVVSVDISVRAVHFTIKVSDGDFDIPPVLVLNSRIVPALHVTRSIEHDLGFATHSHA